LTSPEAIHVERRYSLGDFRAMTNIKSHMENGKWLSLPISRFSDGAWSLSDPYRTDRHSIHAFAIRYIFFGEK
jgi:hypothetical protein